MPLQVGAGLSMPAPQDELPQVVPAAWKRQAPRPSQKPSCRQPLAGSSTHTARGSVPSGTGTQLPIEPATAHERHSSPQAELQQTPSTQKPEVHSRAAVQLSPRPRLGWQVLPAQ